MSQWWLLLVCPAVGALIGWGTNWLAVKMIFHPRTPRRVLGWRVEGLLPRRRADLARNVAETVERDLVPVEMIQGVVRQLIKGERVRGLLHERIETLIDEQIARLGPIVRTMVPKDLITQLKEKVESEIIDFVESISGELHDGIDEHLDIQAFVRERIEAFDMVRLEEIVFRIAARELRHIEMLGALLGAAIGLVQAGIVLALQ